MSTVSWALVALLSGGDDLTHIARNAGNTFHTGLLVEHVGDIPMDLVPSFHRLQLRGWRGSHGTGRVPRSGRPGVKPWWCPHLPPYTAVIEEPLPRWQVMIFRSLMSLPYPAQPRGGTHSGWLVPWKP